MPQVLRLDDGDTRIQYAPSEAWETMVNSGRDWNRDGTYHRAKAPGAQLFFLFRGGSFRLAIHVHVFYMTLLTPRQALEFLSMVSPEGVEHRPNYNSTGRR